VPAVHGKLLWGKGELGMMKDERRKRKEERIPL
jgi:hypothetical protein